MRGKRIIGNTFNTGPYIIIADIFFTRYKNADNKKMPMHCFTMQLVLIKAIFAVFYSTCCDNRGCMWFFGERQTK